MLRGLKMRVKGLDKGYQKLMKEYMDYLRNIYIVDQQACICSVYLDRKDGQLEFIKTYNSQRIMSQRNKQILYE